MAPPRLIEALELRRLMTTSTLVDFGDAAVNNVYGAGWATPIYGLYTGYSADGPDGVIGGWTGAYFAAGVSGTAKTFAVGDQIKSTWHNRGASAITFTPRVSFNDPDQSNGGTSGTWVDMGAITVPAGQSATSTYTFDATWAGSRSLVNVHRNVNGTELLLDKVEWVSNSTNALAVNNGSGDGNYTSGASVAISADTAPSGYQFDRWIGDTAGLASLTSASTTFTMPATAASLAATYIPASGVVVSTVTGSVTHGSTLTINGSRFGTKTQAAPFKRDDFEAGTTGQIVGNGWHTSGGAKPTYSTTQQRVAGRAEKTAFLDFSGNYSSFLGLTSLGLGHGDKVYLSGWYYQVTSGAASRNVKFIAVRGGNPGDVANPEIRVDQYPNTNSGHAYVGGSGGTVITDTWSVGGVLHTGSWHRAEAWIDFGQAGQNNGEFTGWLDGAPWWSLKNFNFDLSVGTFNNIYFSHYFARDVGSPTPQMMQFWDELYVDKSRARVEIGNAPTWEASTHREIQTPTAWSGDSISITVNQGALTNGPAYLYVIDENGNVNQQGYALTVGQTSVVNRAPAVDAGDPQRITTADTTSLDGTAADDGLPGALSYTWSKAQGPGSITFGNASAIDTTATFSAAGEYLLKLSASDGNQTRTDYVTLLVTDVSNRIPVVNLGSSAGGNTFGFMNWNQVTLGTYVGYSANGPAGTKGGSTGAVNVVSVRGANHTYEVGEKVIATWYNDSGSSITFVPKVSFNDPDAQNGGTAGTWYNMSSVTIPAYGTATTSYTIDSGSAGTYSLINVSRFTNNIGAALLDKMELEYNALGLRAASSAVAGRRAFYNNSSFDGNNAAANASDDLAIATDKQALLPGQTADFRHYTSYSRGLNGIIVDLQNLPAGASLTTSDFEFAVGKEPAWTAAPAPLSISVRRGAGIGGSDRVTIIWADKAIQKQWLRVTVKATPQTGLAQADVFYFGNSVGETGNGSDMIVNSADLGLVVNNYSGRTGAAITNPYDINRDGNVNSADVGVISNEYSGRSPVARMAAPPAVFSSQAITNGWQNLFGDEQDTTLS